MKNTKNIKIISITFIGLGTVNIGVLRILKEKEKDIQERHGLKIRVVGVADSSGVAVRKKGFEYQELIDLKANNGKVATLKGHLPGVPAEDMADHVEADILVEGSPVNLQTGRPGLQAMEKALIRGWSAVSANKAPLVLAYDRLHELAQQHGGRLAFSAAVCGGLPVINVLQRDLLATQPISLKGIFNATSNFILAELEKGGSFEAAIEEAQRIGAAEADPSLDVDGYDTANKLFIIMKSFTDFSGTIDDIEIEGIRSITYEKLMEAASRNKRVKLLALAERNQNGWALSVRPVEVDNTSFLGNCDGWEMGIEIQTDYYEALSMKIYEEDPMSTSAAVVRDMINIVYPGEGKI
jgi:homoserine dehydrogenase